MENNRDLVRLNGQQDALCTELLGECSASTYKSSDFVPVLCVISKSSFVGGESVTLLKPRQGLTKPSRECTSLNHASHALTNSLHLVGDSTERCSYQLLLQKRVSSGSFLQRCPRSDSLIHQTFSYKQFCFSAVAFQAMLLCERCFYIITCFCSSCFPLLMFFSLNCARLAGSCASASQFPTCHEEESADSIFPQEIQWSWHSDHWNCYLKLS